MSTHDDSTPEEPANPGDLDYEQARDALIQVVRDLEAGGLSLEESLDLWEQGEQLAKVCERHLEGARERVETALASVEDATDDENERDDEQTAGA